MTTIWKYAFLVAWYREPPGFFFGNDSKHQALAQVRCLRQEWRWSLNHVVLTVSALASLVRCGAFASRGGNLRRLERAVALDEGVSSGGVRVPTTPPARKAVPSGRVTLLVEGLWFLTREPPVGALASLHGVLPASAGDLDEVVGAKARAGRGIPARASQTGPTPEDRERSRRGIPLTASVLASREGEQVEAAGKCGYPSAVAVPEFP